jgi:Fur family transcriptional regulator, iron response regulator
LTAEMLFEEASKMREPPSLATMYNTLSLFTEAGLLRPVSVDGSKTYHDTNVTAHQHFYAEDSHKLLEISDPHILMDKLPVAPGGYEISRVDLVIRIRRKRAS